MSNRIQRVEVRDHSLTPAEAEIWIAVIPEVQTPATEVRGRLTGPRCPYATTVEVAYPLRPFPRPPADLPGLAVRVVVPEASLWEPTCPFLYEATVELWQDGRRCDQVRLSRGLRVLRCGARGLHLNGRALVLRGTEAAPASEAELLRLRQAGYNLLLAPVAEEPLWPLADRLGMLLLGRLPPADEDALARAAALSAHPSCLGWLFPQETAERHAHRPADLLRLAGDNRPLLAMEIDRPVSTPLPRELAFLVWAPERTPLLEGVELPVLVRGQAVTTAAPPAAILGWIDR
jgi:hypothetical protein